MGDFGKGIRLKRVLRQDRGALVVAFDHALVVGPIPGTLHPARQIRRFVEAKVDAILLNLGNFRYFAEAVSPEQIPGLVARLDWTAAFDDAAKSIPSMAFTCLVAHPEDAIRADADGVATFLAVGSGDAEFQRKEVEPVGSLARECERVGMPLAVARGAQVQEPREAKWLMLYTRMAAELGADVIKTENAANVETLCRVIHACPVPILVLGGTRPVLNTVHDIIEAGAFVAVDSQQQAMASTILNMAESARSR